MSKTLRNLWRWQPGRQGTGYSKMLLAGNPFFIPFDVYVLRYKLGDGVPTHTDPVPGKRHYRVNIVFPTDHRGGEFICQSTIFKRRGIYFFRPDIAPHSVTPISAGQRLVLSIGWVRPSRAAAT